MQHVFWKKIVLPCYVHVDAKQQRITSLELKNIPCKEPFFQISIKDLPQVLDQVDNEVSIPVNEKKIS